MTELLVRLFITNKKGAAGDTVRERYGILSGVVGICTNLLLVSGKLAAGLISGSIAVIADAVNNLADATSSVITLIGFKLSAKPADKEHPFGHARFEYISGLAVAILVLLIGIELAKTSVDKIINPEHVAVGAFSIIVLAVSALLKLWQSRFYRSIGRRIASQALLASSTDSLCDVVSTAAVLVSAVISLTAGVNLDAYMGLAVALFILYSGIKLIKEALDPILGEAPDEKLVAAIDKVITGYDNVLGLHDLMVHSYGPGKAFASVHVEVDAKADVLVSHDMIDNIEREVFDRLGVQLVIHYDPVVTDDPMLNELRDFVQRTVKAVNEALTMHDFRIVRGPTHTNLIFDVVVPSGIGDTTNLAEDIAAKIKERDPGFYAVITLDNSYISQNMPAL